MKPEICLLYKATGSLKSKLDFYPFILSAVGWFTAQLACLASNQSPLQFAAATSLVHLLSQSDAIQASERVGASDATWISRSADFGSWRQTQAKNKHPRPRNWPIAALAVCIEAFKSHCSNFAMSVCVSVSLCVARPGH